MPLPAASLRPRLATVARCSTQIRPMTMPRTILAATAPSEGFVAGCAVFIDNDYHIRSGGVFRRRAVSLPSREGEGHFTPANPDIGQGPPWRHRQCRDEPGEVFDCAAGVKRNGRPSSQRIRLYQKSGIFRLEDTALFAVTQKPLLGPGGLKRLQQGGHSRDVDHPF